jgi:DsbC/DsbD-like thiol-disulfide interchange protein
VRFSRRLLVAMAAVTFVLAQAPGVAHLEAPKMVQAKAHATVVANFAVVIDAGFHIQSNHPKLDYLIPTTLTLAPAGGVSVTQVAWPRPQDHKFSFAADPLSVFEGTVKVPVTLKTGAAGEQTLHGTFRYQACNDQLCRPPVSVGVVVTVSVR